MKIECSIYCRLLGCTQMIERHEYELEDENVIEIPKQTIDRVKILRDTLEKDVSLNITLSYEYTRNNSNESTN